MAYQRLGSEVELQTVTQKPTPDRKQDFNQVETSTPTTPYTPYPQHPQHIAAQSATNSRWIQWSKIKGCKVGILGGAISCTVVFIVNLIFTIIAISNGHLEGGIGTLRDGDCDHIRSDSSGIHLAINILSTILLASSNYCMQCLSAPTRDEVDKAHSERFWLDIGVPSFRNFRKMRKIKFALWLCLVSSSLPLHLFFNSAVFTSLAAFGYDVVSISPASLAQNDTGTVISNFESEQAKLLLRKARAGNLTFLANANCIQAYAEVFQTSHSNLVLVTDAEIPRMVANLDVYQPELGSSYSVTAQPYYWMCLGLDNFSTTKSYYPDAPLCQSRVPELKSSPSEWKVGDDKVSYCLSETPPSHCKLQYSLNFAVIILLVNLIKAAIMYYTAFALKGDPLVTTGDAIASFLHRPDETTLRRSLLKRVDAQKPDYSPAGPIAFEGKRERMSSAASKTRWFFCIFWQVMRVHSPFHVADHPLTSFGTGLVVTIVLLIYGITQMTGAKDASTLWGMGVGAISQETLIKGDDFPTTITTNAFIANAPQPIFSFLYFSYNSLFTTMTLAQEWSQFAIHRKGLRVSANRTGVQRSSHFLSLPYRYSLPMMAASAVLHWLISQSLFLVVVQAYQSDFYRRENYDIVTCGYSPIAIIFSISLAGLMLVVLIALGYFRLKSAMPVAGSCSVMIAAACHPAGWEGADIAGKKLMWGVIDVEDGVRRCGFSGGEVGTPEVGKTYY
ncbi:hypothetical protein K402DRAFT_340141 [Aulographum hederae CBS 113979]|uniref:DUF6536 domain-containing protein n=1 Tax=Aulographum hederae CBS 113979 TaxID=1176131 RepID=A0A6G1GNL6_9PEZI|nr:hypothetical protein K402DRAFT_340141 [Aulographum hederae CBS 113979]